MQLAGYDQLSTLMTGRTSDMYRAFDPERNHWVALKVFRFNLADDRAVQRFLEEDGRRAVELSSHPSVAQLYEVGITENGHPYLVMELAEGATVAHRLPPLSSHHFTVDEALRIGTAVAEALGAAHRAGVVHSMLSPASIMLTKDGEPRVTDLGIGLLDERWEAAGHLEDVIPYHAAPEVIERSTPTPAADIYSLATIMYAMVTGHAPHEVGSVDSVSALLLRVLQETVPDLPREASPELNTTLKAALAADAGRRVGTADEFIHRLDPTGNYAPTTGTPAPDALAGTPVVTPASDPEPVAVAPLDPADPVGPADEYDLAPPADEHQPDPAPGEEPHFPEPATEPDLPADDYEPGPAPEEEPHLPAEPDLAPPAGQHEAFMPPPPAVPAPPPPMPASPAPPPPVHPEPAPAAPSGLAADLARMDSTGTAGRPDVGPRPPASPFDFTDDPDVDGDDDLGFYDDVEELDLAPDRDSDQDWYAVHPDDMEITVRADDPRPAHPSIAMHPDSIGDLSTDQYESMYPGADGYHEGPGPLVPVPQAPELEDRRQSRRALLLLGTFVVGGVILLVTVILLAGQREDTPEGDLAGNDAGSEPGTQAPEGGGEGETGEAEAPVLDRDVEDLVVPTDLVASPSEAGVQLEWSSGDGGSDYNGPFAVLVLSEQDPARVELAPDRPSLLIPAVDLRPDNGYCFGVARLDTIEEMAEGRGEDVGGYDVGPAYSEVVCIRGATEDTVRTDPDSGAGPDAGSDPAVPG